MTSVSSIRERNRAVLAAVRRRLEREPDNVLPTLQLLVDPDAVLDPVDEETIALAKTLNAHRVVALLREIRARSYTTEQVREMLGGISRQAVSQRVGKRQLMSIQISGKSYFPEWQFAGGRPIPGLPAVIEALCESDQDTFTADSVMRTSLPEEGGRTPADLLAAGDVDRALHYVRVIGAGF